MIDPIRQAKPELAEICRRHNVRRLDLFGSAVGSNFDPRASDVDFLVEFGVFTKGDVDDELVWDIVETRLPVLREEVERLITDKSDNVKT